MVATDKDALTCDLMETYGVANWRALPIRFAATLACGLRDDSRIKMAMSGTKCKIDTLLLAMVVDGINWLAWAQTEDAAKGKNRPERIAPIIAGDEKKVEGFDSIEEYEAARAEIMEG